MAVRFQSWLAIGAAAAVALTASIGVVVRDTEEVVAVASPTPLATGIATPSPSSSPAAPGTDASAAPSSASPSATSGAPAPTATAQAPVARPPRSGTYTYRETLNGESSDSTIRIEGSGRRQVEVLDDEVRSTVEWRDDVKVVMSTDFGSGSNCDWQPDIQEFKLPFAQGASWSVETKCTLAPGNAIEISGRTTVEGPQTVKVGDRDVFTWKMRSNVTIRFVGAQGSYEETVTSDDFVSPEHGLYVRSVENAQGKRAPDAQPTTRTTERLLTSVTPSASGTV